MVSLVGGFAVLSLTEIERLTVASVVFWIASPLLLLLLMDLGLATEQLRYAELLKGDSTQRDQLEAIRGSRGVSFAQFFKELISLSILPFYVLLFTVIGFGGREITKSNKEATEAAQRAVASTLPYYQQGNAPTLPNRPPIGQFNPAMQRFNPSPFPTPPRFPMPNHPPVAPPKVSTTPASSPISSPVPTNKNP